MLTPLFDSASDSMTIVVHVIATRIVLSTFVRHHGQLYKTGMLGRVVHALSGLLVIRCVREEDVRHKGLRIPIVQGKPA